MKAKKKDMLPFDIIKQYLAPQHFLSRFGGLLANSQIPWLKNYLIRYFLSRYPEVNLSEAHEPNPYAYTSFNDFFTRKLKPNARTIDTRAHMIISPADGCVQNFGRIQDNQLIQAKNHSYEVASLLGNKNLASQFSNSSFITIYLAPKDYHRVHIPMEGTLTDMIYVPGKLFSVNILTTDYVPMLFAKNERVVALFETAYGPMAVILVGAMIVGSIDTTWAGKVAPSRSLLSNPIQHTCYPNGATYQKADEIGFFSLGSTVIVLFPPKVQLLSELRLLQTIQMGATIAHTL
jgi:phosphatidylserine decarboxylase